MAPSRIEGTQNVDILRPGDILNELDGKKPRVRTLALLWILVRNTIRFVKRRSKVVEIVFVLKPLSFASQDKFVNLGNHFSQGTYTFFSDTLRTAIFSLSRAASSHIGLTLIGCFGTL